MKKSKLIWIPVGVVFLVIIFVVMTPNKEEKPAAEEVEQLGQLAIVETQLLQMQDITPQLQVYGQWQAKQKNQLISQQSGKIIGIYFKEGQTVAKDQVIMSIEKVGLQERTNQLLSQIEQNNISQSLLSKQNSVDKKALNLEKKLVNIAEAALKRQRDLSKQNLASQNDVDNAIRTLTSQSLSLQNRQLAINSYSLNLNNLQQLNQQLQQQLQQLILEKEQLQVTAPFTGVLSNLQVELYDSINPQQVLGMLLSDEQVILTTKIAKSSLSASQFSDIQQAQVTIEGKKYILTLDSKDALADDGTVNLEFISDSALPVFINSYVKAVINLPPLQQVYKIDRKSIYDNNRLYVVNDNQLQRMDIDVVGKRGDELIFTSQQSLDNTQALLTHLNDASDGLAVKVLGEQE